MDGSVYVSADNHGAGKGCGAKSCGEVKQGCCAAVGDKSEAAGKEACGRGDVCPRAGKHAEQHQVGKKQITCPVMGGKIDPKLYADVNGKRVYVCCAGCVAAIEKDPDKYLQKMRKEGVAPADAPKEGKQQKHRHGREGK